MGWTYGPVGRRTSVFVAPTPQRLSAQTLGVGDQLLGQPGFTDARLASQHDHLPPAGQRVVQGSSQYRHLLLAADETRGFRPFVYQNHPPPL